MSTSCANDGYSYHIILDDVFFWPSASFGIYCDDARQACTMLEEYQREYPKSKLEIVRYKSVRRNSVIIGIVYGSMEMVDCPRCEG